MGREHYGKISESNNWNNPGPSRVIDQCTKGMAPGSTDEESVRKSSSKEIYPNEGGDRKRKPSQADEGD